MVEGTDVIERNWWRNYFASLTKMSDTKPTVEQILAAVDSLDNDAVDMLKRIVSIDSRLGREADVQQFMFEEFKKINDPQLKVEMVPIIGK